MFNITRHFHSALPAGPHQITFNAAALPSGIYQYELTASTVRLYSRMMLVK